MKKNKITSAPLCVLISVIPLLFFLLAPLAQAQESKLSLSITPPLFQLTIGPGEFWASTLKVVNTNPYDLTLYASVMNFKAEGEEGTGRFTPVIKDDPEIAAHSLAHWIDITTEAIFIPQEKSVDVPFSVRIPKDASPGGHYAAILVGTQPLADDTKGAVVRVSSFVSSLLFVRIQGDVIEEGRIREFSTDSTFYQKSDVDFILRFENTGNVHLQPQGEIVIYNMWGKERGKIAINQKSNFGNVLPQSIRKFVFEWRGEENLFEAGRYKAIVALTYGKEARQNVSRTIYFWIVPLGPTFGILGGFISFIFFLIWGIRAYVKKAITIAQKEAGLGAPIRPKLDPRVLAGPLSEGILDLRQTVKTTASTTPRGERAARRVFIKKYALSFLFMLVLAGGVFGLVMYFGETLIAERSFDIVVQEKEVADEETQPILADKDQMSLKEDVVKESEGESPMVPIPDATVKVLNGSGVPGAAAQMTQKIESI